MALSNPPLRRELLRALQDNDWNSYVTLHHQPFGRAVHKGHTHAVAFLLEQDGIEKHLRRKAARENHVLHKVASCDNAGILVLLTSHFPDGINHENHRSDAPLQGPVIGDEGGNGQCIA